VVAQSIKRIDCEWACFVCSAVCPKQAVTYEDGKIEIDLQRCCKCLVCVRICPVGKMGESDLA